jgi:hypothetical protein
MKSLKKLTFNVYNCAAVAVFVLYDVSSQTVWTATYTSEDAENYGEEDQSVRRARCRRVREKRSKISSVW